MNTALLLRNTKAFILLLLILFLSTTSSLFGQGPLTPKPFIDLEYQYDESGNITSIINHIDPEHNVIMSYDSLDRLTSTSGPWGKGNYRYDSLGNRTAKNINGEFVAYRYNSAANQLADVVHDENGNIVDDGNYRYVYDSENRLKEVRSGNVTVESYSYDAFGRRISKTDRDGNTTYYAYGKGSNVLTEFDENGIPRADFIYAGNKKIARVNFDAAGFPEKKSFYHPNHLGSNVSITDQITSEVWKKEYLPFGGGFENEYPNLVDNSHQYSSKELDGTGLYYFGARYYNPEIGRFMSVDPAGIDITNPQSWNRYAYVQNNPYRFVDPDGRQVVNVQGVIRFNNNLKNKLNFVPGFLLDLFIPSNPKEIVEASILGPQVVGSVITKNSTKALAKPKYFANAGGHIRSFVTKSDETYYRVFSGDKNIGSFVTKVKPRNRLKALEGLALPPDNSALFIQEVLVPAGTKIQRSRTKAVLEFGRKRGGLEQFQLLEHIPIENFKPGKIFLSD